MMKPALLIIDLQRWFLEVGPPEKLARVETLIANTNALSGFFQESGYSVIRIQTVHTADGSSWNQWMKEHNSPRLIEGTQEAEEHPALDRCDSDIVIRKTRHSAFIRTDLEIVLNAREIDAVVLAGFSTNLCVGLTAIEAYERDFKVFLAEEAILGTNQRDERLMLDYLQIHFAIEPVSIVRILEMVST
ncbi:cysteine hydrolase [Chloroflexi bacterium TSY]|nr:cysteine hydrolase [Chloroflexi bacterium TSY]